MSRFLLSLVLLLALFSSPLLSSAESIVSDSTGNGVFLPTTGGNAITTISLTDPAVSTSPYTFWVYLNNGDDLSPNNPINKAERESFYIPCRTFADASMVNVTWQPFTTGGAAVEPVLCHNCMRNATHPNNATGIYAFTFTIPEGGTFQGNITYINQGSAPLPVTEHVTISIYNPELTAEELPTIAGDPQFVGLRGQSYQVHGIDGAVYNLITEQDVQVNSRFVFLTEGECPLINGKKDSNCWTHPGSYLGEMSFQQIVDGVKHTALVLAGKAATGFDLVEVDGETLAVGDSVQFGSFSVRVQSSHTILVRTARFDFELTNSDAFINQVLRAKVPLNQLTSHGLIGQTHNGRTYHTSIKYIQGEVDDYLVEDHDIFGTQFIYNRFQA